MTASTGSDANTNAVFALHRFGLGPRAGSQAAIASDPRGALIADLARPGAARLNRPGLLGSAEAARAAFDFRQQRKAERLASRAGQDAGRPAADPAAAPGASSRAVPDPAAADTMANGPAAMERRRSALAANPDAGRPVPQRIFLQEAEARLDAALTTEIGFAERLAWFWSNHFCISADKGPLRAIVGAYDREAIRPHVAGRFADMLLAVESHPGMLIYLDNARSFGPGSIAGRNRGKGLNENLAREILELHTLGVRTVYTQDDVTRFAAIITGWSVVPPGQPGGGTFVFNPRMHHVAAKLVRHFVSDQPVPALADKLAKRFIATDGDLKEVATTLVTAPESWSAADRKLKRPGEWIVASLRAAGVTAPEIAPVMQAQNMLGEPLWRPAAPKGFADEDAAWIDGLAQRLDISNQVARRIAGQVDPAAAIETALGPLASEETRTAIRRAESRPQALTLLFMAPEFQRR
jgi:uncharacterized protein (DUF1800 family)